MLGLYCDRKGRTQEALDYYRRASEAGHRWLDVYSVWARQRLLDLEAEQSAQ